MALKQFSMALATILATILFAGVATAQSTDCTKVLISMSPCVSYITGNSSTPGSGCCTQLGSVVASDPQCLCEVLNGGGSTLGLNINETQAMALPGVCKVQTPPLSQCNAASPGSSPDSPNTGSGEGSKTTPNGDGFSNASSNKLGFSLLFCIMLVASYATTSNMA